MARPKRKAAIVVIDRTSSDTNRELRPKRQKLLPFRAIAPTGDIENYFHPVRNTPKGAREVFRVLSPAEYQCKLDAPKAWVSGIEWRHTIQSPQTPIVFKSSPAKVMEEGRSRDIDIKQTAVEGARPQRQAARRTLTSSSIIMQWHTDDSEDDLATSPRPVKPAARRKSKARARSDESESDFKASGSSSDASSGSEASAASASDTPESESESEEDVPSMKKRQPAKAKTKAATSSAAPSKPFVRPSTKAMNNLLGAEKGQAKGLRLDLPPLSNVADIFRDLTERAIPKGLDKALQHLQGTPLRVATMCSGTESPLLALEAIRDSVPWKFEIDHLFSAEIVAYKQAYIERNFHPPVLFRDITELTKAVHDDEPMATTAYGAKVPIPRNVHLLVAGTSCVDYSSLNKHKKGIDDGGESGDTYHAVLAYCTAFRPAVVILENVRYADWDRMLADYQELGYESTGALVDTKYYYLPQTRQRGYMVCFDTRQTGADLRTAGAKWTSLMEYFRRPASSPVSSFLPRTIEREQVKDGKAANESDWTKCELRHTQHRYELGLGNQRPVTHWSESGSLIVPENGDPIWYNSQVERVWDLLDIAVLRKALPSNGFYDARYKTRIWDVSQNVDRDKDNIPFGLTGCITPSGMFFLSDAGKVIAPEGLLTLQGLPIEKISFTTETQGQIQDLAGNAMSMTVVGSAILAAIIAGYKAIPVDKTLPPSTSPQSQLPALLTAKTELVELPIDTGAIDVATLLEMAGRAKRHCVCEGSYGMIDRPLQRCTGCGHTTCVSCGGNPAHTFVREPLLNRNRTLPATFEDYLRDVLPLKLRFSSTLR